MPTHGNDTAIRNCRFAFRCDKQWHDLTETTFQEVRFCSDCERDVFLCTTDAQLSEAVRLNRCIALVEVNPDEDGSASRPRDFVGLPAPTPYKG
jgi:hypothetical protein